MQPLNNKGIFNGIDALVLATGNDWRAIEAGAHTYAAQSGSYKGLSHRTSHLEEKKLYGEITLPMPVATKGGSIGLNPTVQVSHRLLGEPSAIELAGIMLRSVWRRISRPSKPLSPQEFKQDI